MTGWLEDRETKWHDRYKDNVLWGTGIADMTAQVLTETRVRGAAPAQEGRMEGREVTARQDWGGLEASQHAGAMQDAEPEKRRPLQQQQKPKRKLQLILQPEPQHEPKPKPKPTLILARWWETVKPQTQSQKAPASPGHAPTTGLRMAERRLLIRRDDSVPPPNTKDEEIASAINRVRFH